MDRRTVLTKTAKGLMEVTGKTSLLSRELRSVLTQVDGKATVGDIHQKLDKYTESKLFETLGKLTKDGFVREFVSAPTSISPPSQVPVVEEEGEDLDFTALTSRPPSRATETAKQSAEADEVARQVASARAKDEAGAKAKRQAEEKEKEKAKRAAEEKAKRESEQKARRESEDKVKRDAEEHARREAKEKARRELDEKSQREAEEQARRAAAERARREEEEQARRAIEERERRAAEERTRKEREAEERIRRELEERIKVAEQQAQREAEARRRREDEERARREAEERAQREAEERARREAEERAQREAQERAQREAEEREKREAEERARREVEEREQRATEEQARREAEEQERAEAAKRAREEEKARAKAEAESAARARREERAREKAEADERAEARAKEAAKERAEVAARLDAIKSGKTGRVGRYVGGGLVALLVIGLIVAQFIPLDTAFYGRIASSALGQPVKIGAGEFSLLPLPTVTLRDVVIGNNGEIRIATAKGSPEIDSLLGATRVFDSVELQGVTAQPAALAAVLWGKTRGHDLVIKRARATGVKLALPGVPLPELTVDAVLGRTGSVQTLTASTAGDRLSFKVDPEGDKAKVEINAKELVGVLGLKLPVEDFGAKGIAVRDHLDLTQFDGKLLDGVVKGKGSLRWNAGWAFEGQIEVRQIDATKIVPSVLSSGTLEGQGTVVAAAPSGEKLFDAPRTEGSFNIGKGQLSNLDLVRMIQTGASAAGATSFNEVTGRITSGPERIELRDLRLSAGPLTANGSIELTSADSISGRITAEMNTPAGVRRGNISLTGSVSKLQAGR
jgi:hypothetical protein